MLRLQTIIQVKIHNNIYNVHLVNEHSKYLVMDDGEAHSGVTDFVTKDIYIRNDLNDEIVADFVANYMIDILGTIDEITSKLRRVVINYETNKKKNNKHSF